MVPPSPAGLTNTSCTITISLIPLSVILPEERDYKWMGPNARWLLFEAVTRDPKNTPEKIMFAYNPSLSRPDLRFASPSMNSPSFHPAQIKKVVQEQD
ncbi:hypothetical protein VTN77DRAFT_8223 [Rasamsonia byssochlamydoides]|uniref:uncharacterized protein n=1 Tax=Rasamsonia byssochlamydoides TaxID=89139 RepID=UPI00374309D1